MKNQILKTLTEKHKRTSLGLGVYKEELLEGRDAEVVNSVLKDLKKEGLVDYHDGTLGRLYKLTKKYLKANL